LLIVRVLVCCLALLLADLAEAANPPVALEHRGWTKDKHWKTHFFRLTLSNERDKPLWFVLPSFAHHPLPENAIFHSHQGEAQPFGAMQREGEGGVAIKVMFIGKASFYAFRIPANGRLEIPDFTITATTDFSELTVIEAQDLKVNGRTSLHTWLPFRATSDKQVKLIEGKGADKDLDWDAEKRESRTDYPSEKVENVEAQGVQRWTVKFEPQGEKVRKGRKKRAEKVTTHIRQAPQNFITNGILSDRSPTTAKLQAGKTLLPVNVRDVSSFAVAYLMATPLKM
jgi:hypothetical protein